MMNRKGQYFIIATVFIVAGIILIKSMFGLFDVARERRFHEATFFEKNIENMKGEYEQLVGMISMQDDLNITGPEYLWNFTNFTRQGINSKILYVFVFANNTENKYHVTVSNFQKDKITVTVNVTDSTTLGNEIGVMNDKQNTTVSFRPSINSTLNVTLTYNTKTAEVIEKFPISTASDSVYSFFDIELDSRNLMVRSKSTYNRTL